MHPSSLTLMPQGELAGWEMVLLSCTTSLYDWSEDAISSLPMNMPGIWIWPLWLEPTVAPCRKRSTPMASFCLEGWLPWPLFPGSSCKGGIAISSQCAWELSWEGVAWIQPPATCCTERMGRSLPRELCNFALQMLARWHRARGGK